MTEPEYAAWLKDAIPAYAEDKIASGQWSEEEALGLSATEHAELLPLGLQTPDSFLFAIVDSQSQPVGMLWFAVQTRFGVRVAHVFDVSVVPERQREGHAYRAFRALEIEVQRQGLAGIALHVFGPNKGAQALYSKLGFSPTNINLFKPVGGKGA